MVHGQLPSGDVTKRLKDIESKFLPTAEQKKTEQAGTSVLEIHEGESDGTEQSEEVYRLLRKSCVEMAMNRVDGKDELFVGGIWALRRPSALKERNITHILSVVRFDPAGLKSKTDTWENYGKSFKHMVIDIDDVDDADILVHLPKAVRFIDKALYPQNYAHDRQDTGGPEEGAEEEKSFEEKAKRLREAVEKDEEASSESESEAKAAAPTDPDAITPAPLFKNLSLHSDGEKPDPNSPGAVYVHCAMGKSRSVTAVVAYLLWKYPSRFGRSSTSTTAAQRATKPDDAAAAAERASAAVAAAVKWVRNTREIAEPNPGFIQQLEMWWTMGCPDDVESHPVYQRWDFRREIDESLAAGQAPSRLRFEDEETSKEEAAQFKGKEMRCKKCRKTLATPRFVLEHEQDAQGKARGQACGHVFVEPLSWMRDELEKGALEGRLCCPNGKCGAAVGRYSWRGFRCSCGGWVTPGFSLQKGRVDEIAVRAPGAAASAAGMASLGIRMPPGAGRL
ncbi:dual specificity protein phosphatase [Colletotrichum tofieldiae]|uniref:protein-tyrosine-phosphatase n=1 Tax=Colletotrichum tofieldiae TaxID=708197 RepID=A0A166MFK0_9PEZI|nr:dual specificity protein phosphatase [Colletotrichum tofieldiae]